MLSKSKSFFKKALSSLLSATCLLSGTAVLGSALTTNAAPSTVSAAVTEPAAATPGASSTDSPAFSWDNATVYFLLTDRFYNGNTSNDNSYGRNCNASGSPVSGWSKEAAFQGGDFAGITKKINDGYFTNLGVNAIWLSAPYEQIHGYVVGGDGNPSFAHYSYHGYYVLDYTEPDLNFGTREEFATMVETAHQNGIRIVLDIVMNHAGYQSLADMSEFGFGPLKSGWDSYYYAHQNVKNELYHGYIDYNGSNAQSEWAKWWGSDWIRCGLAGYTPGNDGDDIDKNLASLPDFKTGSNTQVGIPDFLKRKWQKEGTYDAKISKYGSSNTVRGYIISWLSDWVRTYGIDGFRCDTAKHVELSAWNELKQSAKAALKEWRQNNPSKPGADWTDEFWMTGECWGHKAEKSPYFTTGGFDSMINFEFTGVGSSNTPAAGSVDGVYSRYATAFNNDPQFNMLTYLASHDTSLIKGDRKNAGSFLLMCPGGVQIYYGDEINRPVCQVNSDSDDGAGHKWRSFMNWDSMDQGVLSHWQKLGQFRNNHLSVGAGQHQLISAYDSTNGYTFARTYSKGDIDDKIVATLFASPNTQVTINVNGIFAEGTEITNFYDDTTAKVSGGKVTFNSGANGTILLQEPAGKKGRVNVTHINQDTGKTIKQETVSGLLGESYTIQPLSQEGFVVARVDGSKTGTFSETEQNVTFYYTFDSSNYAYIVTKHVDAATNAEIAESETITGKIGSTYNVAPADIKNYEVDLTKSDSSSGTVKSGTNTVTFKYNYVEPTNLKVHYYNSNNWTGLNMYAYDESGATVVKFLGDWPGKAMTDEGNGWFVCEAPDTESALVIFNGSGGQEPASMQPGYPASGEVWIKDGKVQQASKVVVKYVDTSGKLLATETLKGISGDSYTTSSKTFDGYTLQETPSNATGTYGTSTVTVTYTYKADKVELNNTSTVSATSINLGDSVTVTASSNGASGTTYAVFYKQNTQTSWTKVRDYATGTSIKVTPKAATKYTIRVKAKDPEGNIADKDLSVDVKGPDFSNTSKLSATTITLNNSVTVTCASTGGTSVQYAVFYKQNSQSSWTKVRGYETGTSVKVTPKASTKYTIRVKAKNSDGTIKDKDLALTVKPAVFTNTSSLSATTITQGNAVTVNCSSTGGTSVQYAVFYKQNSQSSWTKVRGYATGTSVKITPKASTKYTIRVKAKNSDETVKDKDLALTVNPGPLTNTSKLSATTISKGSSVTVTCSATGGSGTKQYAVFYKQTSQSSWTKVRGYETGTSVKVTPKAATTYTIRVKAKDGAGTVKDKDLSLKVVAPLENTSKLSKTSISKGDSVTVTCASTGGTGTKQYAVFYKQNTQSDWTKVRGYATGTSVKITPKAATTYTVRVKAKDGASTVVNKDLTLKVVTPLTNTSKISPTTVELGSSVTVTCSATGGTGTKQYAVFYIKKGQSEWTKVRGYATGTSVKVTPKGTGSYTIRVKAKDGAGTVVNKDFAFTSKSSPLTNTSTISATAILKGKSVTVTCASTGGVGTKQYAVFYKRATSSEWTTAQGLSTKTSVSITPASAVLYDVCVKVKDEKETISKQYFTVAVNTSSSSFTNSSKVSATSVSAGTKITITGASSNATDMAMYKYEYKNESAANYTTIKDYTSSTTAAFTPSKAGRYFVRVIALDMQPNTKVKCFTITVK